MAFTRGYKAVEKEIKRQEKVREQMQGKLFTLFLTEDNPECDLLFLTSEPITFEAHQVMTKVRGKERYNTVICPDKGDCPHCDAGNKTSFRGAYLVYDMTPYEYTDAKGKKKKGDGRVKIYITGTTNLGKLDRLNNKYGLLNHEWTMSRTGSSTSTSYSYDRGDEIELSEEEIAGLLPESLAEEYDGDEQSLYDILQSQLDSMVATSEDEEEDEDEDEEDERPKKKKFGAKNKSSKVKSRKNRDDDEDIVDEEDEEEEENTRPVKKPVLKSKSKSSVKSLLRKSR